MGMKYILTVNGSNKNNLIDVDTVICRGLSRISFVVGIALFGYVDSDLYSSYDCHNVAFKF